LARQLVARASEIPVDSMRRVDLDGLQICLAHGEDGGFYAINDICTHEDYSLCEGTLWGLEIECPQHGSRFNLKTGKVTGLPAVIPAAVYPVEVEGEDVYVDA
jgi:3-phenylpropionate/trans-cinnamate dioxygenase ferredoxin subunit